MEKTTEPTKKPAKLTEKQRAELREALAAESTAPQPTPEEKAELLDAARYIIKRSREQDGKR